MHVDVGQPGHAQLLAESRHIRIMARWPHGAHQEIEPHQWQRPSMPAPVSDVRCRFPNSASVMDVASAGVDGAAGEPADLPRGAEADAAMPPVPQPFRQAARTLGDAISSATRMALPLH